MTGATIPDLVDPVLAFRCFRIGDKSTLRSYFADLDWKVAMRATCEPELFSYPQFTNPVPHDAPGFDCRCGLHGHFDVIRAIPRPVSGFLLGAVAAWGRAVIHDDGLRVERMQVLALCDPTGGPRADAVAERVGVQRVCSWEKLEDVGMKAGARPYR